MRFYFQPGYLSCVPARMVVKEPLHTQPSYTLQSEARRIFDKIINDPQLNIPAEVRSLEDKISFVGDEEQPFYPVPHKCAESQAGVLGLVGLWALAIAKDRYGKEHHCEIDVAQALLNGLGSAFHRLDGDWLAVSPKMVHAVHRWDHGQTRELYRQLATNIYRTKDERWYALHGNMDPTPLLEMLDIPQHNEQNLSWPDIIAMYAKVVSELDSKTLDNWSNNVYRTPGTICYKEEEFKATPHVRPICYSYTGVTDKVPRARPFGTNLYIIFSGNHIIPSLQWLGPRFLLMPLIAALYRELRSSSLLELLLLRQ